MAEENGSLTGLTDNEAKEFHQLYLQGFMLFTGVAVVAHLLVWLWRPWIPPEEGYTLLEGTTNVASSLLTMIS
jgi:light-harvesting complex 1 beta chain